MALSVNMLIYMLMCVPNHYMKCSFCRWQSKYLEANRQGQRERITEEPEDSGEVRDNLVCGGTNLHCYDLCLTSGLS